MDVNERAGIGVGEEGWCRFNKLFENVRAK
jgi:hypothetical protein